MLRRVKSQSKILMFMTHQLEQLVSIQSSPESESLGEGDLGLLVGGSITQGMIHEGTSIISSNFIMHVLTDSIEMILKSDSFTFNPPKAKTLVIAPPTKPFLSFDRDVRASSGIGDSRPEHGRIGTTFVNKDIWSGDDNFNVRSDVGEFDTLVPKRALWH